MDGQLEQKQRGGRRGEGGSCSTSILLAPRTQGDRGVKEKTPARRRKREDPSEKEETHWKKQAGEKQGREKVCK